MKNKFFLIIKLSFIESRNSRKKLAFAIFSLMLGVATLTSVKILIFNFESSIYNQAKELMGADFSLDSNFPFDKRVSKRLEKALASIKGVVGPVEMVSFYSMINKRNSENIIDNQEESQLVSVKAYDKFFPFYGKVETEPKKAWNAMLNGEKSFILLAPEVLSNLNLKIGEKVYLGKKEFIVSGVVKKESITNHLRSIAPNIYVHKKYLYSTGFLNTASRIQYKRFYKSPSGFDIHSWKEKYYEEARVEKIQIRTYLESNGGLQNFLNRLSAFMNILALIILLLSSVGVGVSIHAFMQGRILNSALYRTMGLTSKEVFTIYLLLAFFVGFFASLLGALLGGLVISSVNYFSYFSKIKELFPFQLEIKISFLGVLSSILTGVTSCIIFVFWPVYKVQKISILSILRKNITSEKVLMSRKELFRIIITLMIFILLTLSLSMMGIKFYTWKNNLSFMCLLLFVLVALWFCSSALKKFVLRIKNKISNFHLRQGIANLARPLNQTNLIVTTIGLSFFLLSSVFLFQKSFEKELNINEKESYPNYFIFDIQKKQYPTLEKILNEFSAKNIQITSMMMGRLKKINNIDILKIKLEKNYTQQEMSDRLLTNELYLGFRDRILSTEKIISGKFWRGNPLIQELSVEKTWAKTMGVKVGDVLNFDIQGFSIEAKISNIRKVQWNRLEANTFLLLSPQDMEKFPYFHVGTYRLENKAQARSLQNQIVNTFPNINIVYMGEVIEKITFISKIIFSIVKFLAIFTFLNGIIILIGALYASRFLQIRETMLYKIIGASSWDLFKILFYENACLAIFSCVLGLALSLISNFIFFEIILDLETHFPIPLLLMLGFLFFILIELVGFLFTRSVINTKPIDILKYN